MQLLYIKSNASICFKHIQCFNLAVLSFTLVSLCLGMDCVPLGKEL